VVVVVGSVVVVVGSVVVVVGSVVVVVGAVVVVVGAVVVVVGPVVSLPGLVVPVLPGRVGPVLPIGTTSPSITVEPGGSGTTTSSPVSGSMMRAVDGAGRMIAPVLLNDTATAGWLGGMVVEAPFSPVWADGAASSTESSPPWFTHVNPMATAKITAARRVSPTEP
jgi:hypothetical protein